MEVEAACILFNRSIDRHGLRYTIFVGDGDSKAYDTVVATRPYGNIRIQKEECMNHVAKRLGSALRKLKKKLTSMRM